MTDPVVSVVVPTFGRPLYLERALQSVLLQTFQDWECIVVNDAGGGDIRLPDDPRFRLIQRQRNGGPAAARNSGIEAARGLYIAFLDDDDLLTPVRLHAAMAECRGEPNTITIVQLLRFDEHGLKSNSVRTRRPRAQARRHRTHFPHGGQVLVPRNLAQLFDESFRTAEDAEWWLRVACRAQLRSSPMVGYLMRQHTEPRLGIDQETRFVNRTRVYETHEDYMHRHRRARSFAAARIASSALMLGEPRTSAIWAKRSLFAFPSSHAAKVLGRAVIGVNKQKRVERG